MKRSILDRREIDRALPRVAEAVKTYSWLQAELLARDVTRDPEYRTRFAGFYRVRRNAQRRGVFFHILEKGKRRRPRFSDVLRTIHRHTGVVEASFASKLVATLDPSQPVIDSVVLSNLQLRLPPRGEVADRLNGIVDLHRKLQHTLGAYLKTTEGRYLVSRFRQTYPAAALTEIKMLDLVLWKTRRRPAKR